MPNRVLKESIRTSRSVNAMTDFQFRVWSYLITYVDDYGRGSADPELLKGFLFPRRKRVTETDIAKALADLAGMGCILLYEIDGESYLCFPKWSEHQRIQQKRSKYPAPPEAAIPPLPTVGHGDPPSESNPIQSESKSESEAKIMSEKPKPLRFCKPSVEEIRAYCAERGNNLDAERFFDHYEAKGWMIGKSPMKDWKAAVRTWEKSERGDPHGTPDTSASRDEPAYGIVL